LNAFAGAVIDVPGKARRRGALLCARRSNAAWRGERGAGECIALSPPERTVLILPKIVFMLILKK
jgi:hypothetical protein